MSSSPTASVASAVPGTTPVKKKAAAPKKVTPSKPEQKPKTAEDYEEHDFLLKTTGQEKRKWIAEAEKLAQEYEDIRKRLEEARKKKDAYIASYDTLLASLQK